NLRSRVFGVGLKDRGAILPAGRSANGAYWLCDSTGNWITSSWYRNRLPKWVTDFNKERKIDQLALQGWDLLEPASRYAQSTTDASPHESPIARGMQTVFPYKFDQLIGKNYNLLRYTPHGNTLTFDFARALIDGEKLGTGAETDLL